LENVIVFPPPMARLLRIACRNEPAPLSDVFATTRVAAPTAAGAMSISAAARHETNVRFIQQLSLSCRSNDCFPEVRGLYTRFRFPASADWKYGKRKSTIHEPAGPAQSSLADLARTSSGLRTGGRLISCFTEGRFCFDTGGILIGRVVVADL